MDPLEHVYNSKYAGLAVILFLVSAKLTIWVAGRLWLLLHLRSQVCFFDPVIRLPYESCSQEQLCTVLSALGLPVFGLQALLSTLI